MDQRFLTEDEISDARAMIGWTFWVAPAIFGLASLGLGIGAIGGNPAIVFAFLLVFSAAVMLYLSRVRAFKKLSHDIEMRVAEVLEGAPEKFGHNEMASAISFSLAAPYESPLMLIAMEACARRTSSG